MKKIILTSVLALGVIAGANATTYIGNPGTPTADWGNWINAIVAQSPESGAAINNLGTAVNDNAATLDNLNQIMADWNGAYFSPNGLLAQWEQMLFTDENSYWARTFGDNGLSDKISELSNNVQDMKDKMNAGIASAAALSGLDNHLDAGKNFGIGFGTGYYNTEGGFAFGAVARTSSDSALNAGMAVSTGGDFTFNGGWNIQF